MIFQDVQVSPRPSQPRYFVAQRRKPRSIDNLRSRRSRLEIVDDLEAVLEIAADLGEEATKETTSNSRTK
jgi:hypothetical protein